MKKIYVAALACAFAFNVSSANAWTINERSAYSEGDAWTTVTFDIINDSTEFMQGFGVGAFDISDRPNGIFAPSNSLVGDWISNLVTANAWSQDTTAMYGSGGELLSYENYFGISWEASFGEAYTLAYVAIPDYGAYVNPGVIYGGTFYISGYDGTPFGYGYSDYETPCSPAIALLGGITYVGETDFSNPNPGSTPVPEPATMLLFGTGLAGLVGLRRKLNK